LSEIAPSAGPEEDAADASADLDPDFTTGDLINDVLNGLGLTGDVAEAPLEQLVIDLDALVGLGEVPDLELGASDFSPPDTSDEIIDLGLGDVIDGDIDPGDGNNDPVIPEVASPFPAVLFENTTGFDGAAYTGPPDDFHIGIGAVVEQ